jgi:AraC family transcriptional regulator
MERRSGTIRGRQTPERSTDELDYRGKSTHNANDSHLYFRPDWFDFYPDRYAVQELNLIMSSYPPPYMKPVISVSGLLAGPPMPQLDPTSECRLLRVALQDGIDVLVWKGELQQPMTMGVHDDWDRIHFSCALQGSSQFVCDSGTGQREHVLQEGSGLISYTPDCKGQSSYTDKFEIVTVSVRPDLLEAWTPDLDVALRRQLSSGRCYASCRRNAEMRATAQALSRALGVLDLCPDDETNRSPLWLLGQSLVLVSLATEAYGAITYTRCEISVKDRQRLLRAKDRLLENLAQAPTIAELAREADLSVLKLKRGFRQLFNHSVYGLFQQERMHEARRRLCAKDTPVMVVASELGYTNASHFSAAFQKQFGVNPSALKRRQ